MPCYDPDSRPDAVRADVLKEARHNSDVAQLLCEACQVLDGEGRMGIVSPELLQWWTEHQNRDVLRKAVQEATGAKLDYYGTKRNIFRFINEPDDYYRTRVLRAYT